MRRHGCTQRWFYHFIGILVIYPVKLAYNVSYWQVKTVIDHSERSPTSCNIDAVKKKNEQYCVFLRLNFTRADLSRNYNVNYPVRRTGKHGETTLTLQRKLFVQDLTIFMDVEANQGPDQPLNEIISCSTQGQVTGIMIRCEQQQNNDIF